LEILYLSPLVMSEQTPPNVGVSRSLFSKLNGMYTAAKSYVPSVANSSLTRIESGVTSLIERNVSPELVVSLESQLDNLLTPHMSKFNKVAELATPTVKRVEKQLNDTIEGVRRSKERFDNLVENAKQLPQNLQDRANAITLDSIQRMDTAIDYLIPVDANIQENENKPSQSEQENGQENEPEQEEPLQVPDAIIQDVVKRSVTISSKNLLGKVNKRIQKQLWQRVASAQGFAKRQTAVIHTSLVDYASTAMNYAAPDNVRAMYDAILKFPDVATDLYIQLESEGTVNPTEFRDALQQKMGDTWVESMGAAAVIYCTVINGALQASGLASQTRDSIAERIQKLVEDAINKSQTNYTVVTERAAIVFNKIVPRTVREAATAYLKRINEMTDVSALDDSFLREYSSKITTVISLAQNDLHEKCVRLYDPIKSKWESKVNFDFGRSLVSLLNKVPTPNVSKIYGFFQALLSVEHIKKMRDFAAKAMKSTQSPVERAGQAVNDIAPVTSSQNLNRVADVCNDVTTPAVISLDVMAERVYANLRNAGDTTTVVFDTFLSTLRTQFELESGREWKQNFRKITRRMFENFDQKDDSIELN